MHIGIGWELDRQLLARLRRENLEIKFQRELNQARGSRRSGKAELRGSALSGKILVRSHFVGEGQIRMIPDVEQFRPKFKVHLFVNRKFLYERHVPVLQAGTANDIPPRIAERSERGVRDECAGIEDRAGNARSAVRISNHVRTGAIEHSSAAIGVGDIYEIVGGSKPVPRLSGDDSSHLPVSHQLILDTGCIAAEALPVPKGKIVDVAENEAMANIKIGVAILQEGCCLQTKISLVLRTQARIRSIV
jgi:hypothetical protein